MRRSNAEQGRGPSRESLVLSFAKNQAQGSRFVSQGGSMSSRDSINQVWVI